MDFYEFFAPKFYGKEDSSFTYEEQAILDLFPGKTNEEMIQILEDSIEASNSTVEKNIFSGMIEKLKKQAAAQSKN